MIEESMSTSGPRTETARWRDGAYIGMHYDLHANPNDTELGKDLTHAGLKATLLKLGVDWVVCDCKGVPGYVSYPSKVGTPAQGIVQDPLRIHRDVTRELGIPLGVHYCGLWDDLSIANHPEWATIHDPSGKVQDPPTHWLCLNSDYRRDLMIPQMLEIIDMYDVDAFWVDAENWGTAPCYCERCKGLYRQETGVADPPKGPDEPGWLEWGDFHRRCFVRHVTEYTEAIHHRKPTCLVASNWAYALRQPEPVEAPVDWLSGDTFTDGPIQATYQSRFLSRRGKPWELCAWGFLNKSTGAATKTVEHLAQEAAPVLACGGGWVIYHPPQRSGHLVPWQHDVLAEAFAFCRARQDVVQDTQTISQVGVLHSRHHHYLKGWPLYDSGHLSLEPSAPVVAATVALLENHYHVDIITEEEVLSGAADFAMIVVPEQEALPLNVVEALKAYVQSGGRLLVTGATTCSAFSALAGFEEVPGEPLGQSGLPADGKVISVAGGWFRARPTNGQSVLSLLEGADPERDVTEWPAAIFRRVGEGRVVAAGGPIFKSYSSDAYPLLRAVIKQLCEWLEPDVRVQLAAPASVHMSLRQKEGRTLIHLVNLASEPALRAPVTAVETVPRTGPITVRLKMASAPSSVDLVPADSEITWTWDGEWLEATLSSLHIHSVIAVQ